MFRSLKKRVIVIVILCTVLLIGCSSGLEDLKYARCLELKSVTLKLVNQQNELNINYNYNFSSETDIKIYNELCGKVTGEMEFFGRITK